MPFQAYAYPRYLRGGVAKGIKKETPMPLAEPPQPLCPELAAARMDGS